MAESSPKQPNSLLQQAREAKGWTQSQLAEQMNVSTDTIRSWESGRRRNPFPSQRTRLCEIFQLSPEQLGFVPRAKSLAKAPPPQTPILKAQQIQAELPASVTRGGQGSLLSKQPSLQFHRQVDKNRRRFLASVRSLWIDGVLTDSLHDAVLLELGLMELPEALANPWQPFVQETEGLARHLPLGTTIVQVYDEAEGELLILGEPGAGKTTLLLELTRELLQRAAEDESEPLPVVFNLSSWTNKHASLADWMVEELRQKYQVPRKVAQEWIETDQLAILLDSLDEAPEEARASCVKAITLYHQDHLVPLIVSCRREEYFATPTRVAFQQAVLIQPLTREQIDTYLQCVEGRLEAVQKALEDDAELLEMMQTPLLLNIISLIYQGNDTTLVLTGSKEERRQQILHTYVQRMLLRRRVSSYQSPQTTFWLSWLAQQMQQGQTEFAVERMQPDGLPTSRLRCSYQSAVIRIYYGIAGFVFAAIFSWIRGGRIGALSGVGEGLLGWLGAKPGNAALEWMAPGLGGGIEGGGSLAIILAIISALIALLIGASGQPALSLKAAGAGLASGLRTGGLCGVIIGLLSGPIFVVLDGGVKYGLMYGTGVGVISGLVAGLMSGLLAGLSYDPARSRLLEPNEKRSWLARLGDGLIIGFCSLLGFEMVGMLLHLDLAPTIADGLLLSLVSFFTFGFGGGTNMIHRLGREITPVEMVTWSWLQVRQDLKDNLSKGAAIAGTVMVPTGAVVVAIGAISYNIPYGIRYGFIYGIIVGVVAGVAGTLAGILKSGWNGQTLSEHQHFKPNAGIVRTAWHGVIAACIFGPVGGIASGIGCALAFGLVGGLSNWLILGIGFALILGIEFAMSFGLLQGGLAWIEHYLLRWYLRRAGYIPANYIAFLDYAVERIFLRRIGGEYMFVHRLLMDYFASLPVTQDADLERSARLLPEREKK